MLETLPLHHIARVVSLLSRGQVVAYPTGTSYGLGVNALDQRALEQLSALKQRPEDKTYTVLLPEQHPERFVAWTDEERQVFAALRDRPLTLLVNTTDALQHLAKEGRVGVRTPDHPFTRELVTLTTFPVTATSANTSGETSACTLAEVEALAKEIRIYAVDGGSLVRCLPSTVAALENGRWRIVRNGDVTTQELEDARTSAHSPSSAAVP
ncbi:MAG: tRNA threonylcarbamoyladenosine biosynthesis protein [Parcubacteria group bacterium Gr01-1014_38]|nr:MAG: tRNA threonylcarbamoyladenosine biosynthesis protein [Parcubacteria group bacterium Gr01-1014_38]